MIPVSKIMGSKFGGIKLIKYLCTAIQQSIYLIVANTCKKRTQRCVLDHLRNIVAPKELIPIPISIKNGQNPLIISIGLLLCGCTKTMTRIHFSLHP